MTTTDASPAALTIALAYHHAWTAHDLEAAMSYVAEHIVCQVPGARIEGVGPYRAFLSNFAQKLTGVEMIAAFGDHTTAVLMYYPHTAVVTTAPTAECFSVTAGRITHSQLVFDRPSFTPPAG
ncbi:MAG: nuclear transport factor 2 family protein [Mycobacteriales bacterium]